MERQNRVRKIGPISRELDFNTKTGFMENEERRISSSVVDLAIRVSRVVFGEPENAPDMKVTTYFNSNLPTTFQFTSGTDKESSTNLLEEMQ